jgi:type I restriction enzyme R subunit
LSIAEAALYDAIAQNDATVMEMGDDTLKHIAIDLVWAIRSSVTIDWNLKESVRAQMRTKIKRLLAKDKYPPDQEAKAMELVLEQAELIAGNDVQAG